MTRGSRIAVAVLLLWGIVGWGLLLRPLWMHGKGVSLPFQMSTTGAVSAGDNVVVAAETGYVTSWRVGPDGKLTPLDKQMTVPVERRVRDAGAAVSGMQQQMTDAFQKQLSATPAPPPSPDAVPTPEVATTPAPSSTP